MCRVAVVWASRWCVAVARFLFDFGVGAPVFVLCLAVVRACCVFTTVIILASRLWGERAQFGLDGRFRVILRWVGQVLLHH